ncbi:ABC transporter ATP-binding protein [Actinokineospora sp. NPDC004072]
MEMRAEAVAVAGMLAATSLRVASGQLAVVAGEPDDGHTAFGLAITGRLRPSTGTVSGIEPRRSAVVDAPGVSEPEAKLRAADVVAEALALLGGRGNPNEIARRHGIDPRDVFETVPAAARTALLADLAATDLLVLDTPDRHSGDPETWWPTALRHARKGRAVVVLCGSATARLLPITPARLGETDQPDPLETR